MKRNSRKKVGFMVFVHFLGDTDHFLVFSAR